MEFLLYGLVGVALLIALLSAVAPTRVSYTEEIAIRAPAAPSL